MRNESGTLLIKGPNFDAIAAATPEPSTLVLGALGILSIAESKRSVVKNLAHSCSTRPGWSGGAFPKTAPLSVEPRANKFAENLLDAG
jgi:hypothetical protein